MISEEMSLLASRARKTDLIIFSEFVRDLMEKCGNLPCIRTQKQFFTAYKNVFSAQEAIQWICENLTRDMPVAHNQLDSSAEDFQDINYSAPYHNNNNIDPLNQKHATKIFQRFLEAEIIKCVPDRRLDYFPSDRTFFQFAIHDLRRKGNNFNRIIAMAYHLFCSAEASADQEQSLFEVVYSQAKFMGNRNLKASNIVSWISSFYNVDRVEATHWAHHIYRNCIIESVQTPHKSKFEDNGVDFYKFSEVFTARCRSKISVERVLDDNFINFTPKRRAPSPPPSYESLLDVDGKVTVKALQHPEAPFIKRNIKIIPDGLGYGFCVRGENPCYIKLVDIEGPAIRAGLKIHQYIENVNGHQVLNKSYGQVEKLILAGNSFERLDIRVFERVGDDETSKFSSNSSVSSGDTKLGQSPSTSNSSSNPTSEVGSIPSNNGAFPKPTRQFAPTATNFRRPQGRTARSSTLSTNGSHRNPVMQQNTAP